MTDKVRVGLVGTGFGTRVHLPGYHMSGTAEVVAVASAQRARAEEAAATWGIPWHTDDYGELVRRDDVDVVDVCVPPLLHRPVVMAALAAGKHVLCEKPFAGAKWESAEMLDAADKAGVVHAVNHELRYTPVRRHLRSLVAEGFIGLPQFVVVNVHADQGTNPAQEPYYFGWVGLASSGGGFVMSSLSHHLDLAQYTFGRIVDVTGRADTLITERPCLTFEYRDGDPIGPDTPTEGTKPVDADDAVALHARIGGALLSVAGSWSLRFPAGNRVDAYGDEGSLHLEPDGRLLGARRGDAALAEIPVPPELALESADGVHMYVPHFAALVRELSATVRGEEVADPVLGTFADADALQSVLDAARGMNAPDAAAP